MAVCLFTAEKYFDVSLCPRQFSLLTSAVERHRHCQAIMFQHWYDICFQDQSSNNSINQPNRKQLATYPGTVKFDAVSFLKNFMAQNLTEKSTSSHPTQSANVKRDMTFDILSLRSFEQVPYAGCLYQQRFTVIGTLIIPRRYNDP